MAYTKLFSSIITSTIWSEDDKTRIVWISMLALADKNGEVQGSIPGLARIAGVAVEDCRAAITKFLSPDVDSRTKDDEGRRIEEIDGGWSLLNHRKYRDMASDADRAEKAAIRQQRKRIRDKRNERNPVTLPSRNSHAPVTPESHQNPQAEADTDTEANTERGRREERPSPPPQLSDILPTGAAQDMLALQSKIQGLKKEWKLALTYEEQKAMLANGACLYSLEEADWTRLRLYLAAKVPEGANYWQPRNRGQFIASLPDVHGHACRWEEKQGLAPKKKGWS